MQQWAGPESSISSVKLEPWDQIIAIRLKSDLGVPENQRNPWSLVVCFHSLLKCVTSSCAPGPWKAFAFTYSSMITLVTNTHSLTQSLIGNVNQYNGSMCDLHIRSIICRLGQSVLHPWDVVWAKWHSYPLGLWVGSKMGEVDLEDWKERNNSLVGNGDRS